MYFYNRRTIFIDAVENKTIQITVIGSYFFILYPFVIQLI